MDVTDRAHAGQGQGKRHIDDLSDPEIMALAISSEEESEQAYLGFAEQLCDTDPDGARLFAEMAEAEADHRHRLIDLFKKKFGDTIPAIRAADVSGVAQERPSGLVTPLSAGGMRKQARQMEANASRFYHQAASRTFDATIRNLFGDLAMAEAAHENSAGEIDQAAPPAAGRARDQDNARRRFILQVIQPGLEGLMDGSVSTLAPVFAAAFATHVSWNAFVVGMAASIGAGISMGFAEALTDDGKISGRGKPYLRGLVCGLMTTAGGIGHTVPFLIPSFWTAMIVAGCVVAVELLTIACIQWKYMETPPVLAAAKVMLGGSLVLAAGILIGSS